MGDIVAMLRFTAVLVALNILVLPLYLVPGLNLVVFYVLNGCLFGREYAEAVALRRMPPPEVRAWRRAHGGTLWLAGVAITLVMMIPVVNAVAPVVAAVFMTHVFHGRGGLAGASPVRRRA
jgi:CysZ protein